MATKQRIYYQILLLLHCRTSCLAQNSQASWRLLAAEAALLQILSKGLCSALPVTLLSRRTLAEYIWQPHRHPGSRRQLCGTRSGIQDASGAVELLNSIAVPGPTVPALDDGAFPVLDATECQMLMTGAFNNIYKFGVNPATGLLLGPGTSIPMGAMARPRGMAVAPDNSAALVALSSASAVRVLDPKNGFRPFEGPKGL